MKIYKILKKIARLFFYKDPLEILKKRGLVVGKNFHILNDVIIDDSHCWHISIGDNVTLAPRVHILAHDASTKILFGYARIGKVQIGNNVFIGASSIIMPGVFIGNNVIIGAGSLVIKDIPDNVVAAGNPAKIICTLNDFINRRKSEMNFYPVFDKEYTLNYNVTDEMKNEMNAKMKKRFGYIY